MGHDHKILQKYYRNTTEILQKYYSEDIAASNEYTYVKSFKVK